MVNGQQLVIDSQQLAVILANHYAMYSMSFTTPTSSIIIASAIISTVAAVSTIVIIALPSYVILPPKVQF